MRGWDEPMNRKTLLFLLGTQQQIGSGVSDLIRKWKKGKAQL
jgi:hypothetical protein